jgi:hypothetical protein
MANDQIFVLLPVAVGGIFSLFGLYMAATTIRFVRAAARTTGLVLGHAKHTCQRDNGPSTCYHAEIEFEDHTGKVRRAILTQGAGVKNLLEGHRVWVLYDTANPLDARLDRALDLWLFPVVFLTVGLLAIAFGVWTLCFGVPQGFTIGGPM